MADRTLRERTHDVDVTVWIGKAGVEAVADELSGQLDDRLPDPYRHVNVVCPLSERPVCHTFRFEPRV